MVLLYFFSKGAAQIRNVPQRPDDDIVETIYKAWRSYSNGVSSTQQSEMARRNNQPH